MCFLGVHWLVLVIVVQIKLVYRVVISTDCRSSCASFFLLISKATYFKNHLTGWMNFTYIFVLINFLHYIYEKESVKLYFICLYHYQTHLAITYLQLHGDHHWELPSWAHSIVKTMIMNDCCVIPLRWIYYVIYIIRTIYEM